jgi:anthranilate phosphoribosyltransferase
VTKADLLFPEVFTKLVQGDLDGEWARRCFDAILGGAWSPVQIAAFLGALRVRGESSDVIAAAAQSMRAAMFPVAHDFPALLDTCGTGGDSSGSVNLSTGAAIIAAACGVAIAKHGNRAASSQAGSADVLEALGVPITLTAEATGQVLEAAQITFMMAPNHHPAMRFAGPVRKELAVRTIFNCLGPLANPASATHQLIGAFSDELRPVLAETLRTLGTKRAWVVRGEDGMDELSPYGPTRVTQLDNQQLEEFVVQPEDFGLAASPAAAAAGGTAKENAAILLDVLAGKPHRARNAFVLNAAGALVVANKISPREAAKQAAEAIDDGRALAKLQQWKLLAQRHSQS